MRKIYFIIKKHGVTAHFSCIKLTGSYGQDEPALFTHSVESAMLPLI